MMRWIVVVVAASARLASAAPLDERLEPALPDYIIKTAPLPGGGALVLGDMMASELLGPFVVSQVQRVVTVDARGVVVNETIPDVGHPLDVAVLDGTAWVLGTTGVAVEQAGARWRRIETERRTQGDIVITDATHAIVTGTGRAVRIDASAGTVETLLDVPGYRFGHGVADGSGGMWAIVLQRDSVTGYTHYTHAGWTLWPFGTKNDDLTRAGFQIASSASSDAVYIADEIVSDGHGGWFAKSLTELVHVSEDGTASIARNALPLFARSLAWDAARERLLVFVPPEHLHEPARILELDATGKQLAAEDVPTPSWVRERRNVPPPYKVWISAGSTTWISFGAFVLTRQAQQWRVAYSPALRDRIERVDRDEQRRQDEHFRGSIAVPVTITAANALGGSLGAAAIHGDRRAGLEMLFGSAGALAPQMLIDATLPFTWVEPDDRASKSDQLKDFMVGGVQKLAFLTGVIGTTTLGGLGAWQTGDLLDKSRSRTGAMIGSFTGAAIGTAGSVLVTNWMAQRWPERYWLRVTVGSTLVGLGASLGYQVGIGSPR